MEPSMETGHPVAAFFKFRRSLAPTPRRLQVGLLGIAFLFPLIAWWEAVGVVALAILFVLLIAPHLDEDRNASPPTTFSQASTTACPYSGIILSLLILLALTLVFRHRLYVVAAAWAIVALGDTAAGVARETFGGPALPYNPRKSWWGFVTFILVGAAGAYVLFRWVNPALPADKAAWISAAAALVGAFVETVPTGLDDNINVPLVSSGFVYCALLVERSALDSNLPYLGLRAVLAVGVCLMLALVAFRMKLVTHSGAVAGFLLSGAVYLAYGYKSFLILTAFFLLASLATRLGYTSKAARGLAQGRGGARTWREVLANGLPGAFFAILVITTHHEAAFLVAFVAVFAQAAGDTVSSEIGQWLSDRAYLITNLETVPAGTDGGITLGGMTAGLVASCLVASCGYGLGLCGLGGAAVAAAAGVAGNLLDSLLGATIERRGLVTNGIVNFASASFAGAVALAIILR